MSGIKGWFINSLLWIEYPEVLQFYLSGRYFRKEQDDANSVLKEIRAQVPHQVYACRLC